MEGSLKHFLVAFSLLSVATATGSDPYTTDDFINYINAAQNQWVAGRNFDLNTEISILNPYLRSLGKPLIPKNSVKGKGIIQTVGNFLFNRKPKPRPTTTTSSLANITTVKPEDLGAFEPEKQKVDDKLPTEFDARDRWPHCKDVISRIIEQPLTKCSVDWATSVVGAMQDRFCIQYDVISRTFSVSQILECCRSCGECEQGSVEAVYDYFKKFGVPSGKQLMSKGPMDAGDGCRPYSSGNFKYGSKNKCSNQCSNDQYKTPFTQDLEKIYKYYVVPPDMTNSYDGTTKYSSDTMKREIRRFGSLTATFTFYHDLIFYIDGVYAPTPDAEQLGKITIKVIGWGVEAGKEYWLASNIWKQDWGFEGFVKLEAWNVKLDLESNVVAGRL